MCVIFRYHVIQRMVQITLCLHILRFYFALQFQTWVKMNATQFLKCELWQRNWKICEQQCSATLKTNGKNNNNSNNNKNSTYYMIFSKTVRKLVCGYFMFEWLMSAPKCNHSIAMDRLFRKRYCIPPIWNTHKFFSPLFCRLECIHISRVRNYLRILSLYEQKKNVKQKRRNAIKQFFC